MARINSGGFDNSGMSAGCTVLVAGMDVMVGDSVVAGSRVGVNIGVVEQAGNRMVAIKTTFIKFAICKWLFILLSSFIWN
jgi:hypothetical protein